MTLLQILRVTLHQLEFTLDALANVLQEEIKIKMQSTPSNQIDDEEHNRQEKTTANMMCKEKSN